MTLYRTPALILLPLLLACACAGRGAEDYPHLLPMEQVLADPALSPQARVDPDVVTQDLTRASAALDARAAALRNAAASGGATSAARADSLRQRAAAIRAGGTDGMDANGVGANGAGQAPD